MEPSEETVVTHPYRKLKNLTPEEKKEHRRSQLRASQLRYREKNGLIKPKETDEDKLATRKEKVPLTYTVEYKRQYYRDYYEKNKAKLLARSKEFVMKKKQQQEIKLAKMREKMRGLHHYAIDILLTLGQYKEYIYLYL